MATDRSGVALVRTLEEVHSRFPDQAACIDHLARLRWPNGFNCPKCQLAAAWIASDGLRICESCGRRTSITAGTIFDRTRTPLPKWFKAVWMAANDNQINAVRLREAIELASYETAWAWLHRLRRAMADPVPTPIGRPGCVVEIARARIAGVSRGNTRLGRATIPILLAVHMIGDTPHRIKLSMSYESTTVELRAFSRTTTLAGSLIRITPQDEGAQALTNSPQWGIRQVANELEAWLVATLHQGVDAKHLPYYLDEFAFRFNCRDSSRSARFESLLTNAVATDPWPLQDLTNP